jgi:hypothetical protein
MQGIVFIAAFLFCGCGHSSVAPTAPFNTQATIAQGKTVSIVDGVTVHFVGVSGDSRCPGDAICIQGGDAIVKLQLTSAGDRRDIELHTGSMQPVTSGNLTIELVDLMPYPFSSHPIKPDEYRATLRVSR